MLNLALLAIAQFLVAYETHLWNSPMRFAYETRLWNTLPYSFVWKVHLNHTSNVLKKFQTERSMSSVYFSKKRFDGESWLSYTQRVHPLSHWNMACWNIRMFRTQAFAAQAQFDFHWFAASSLANNLPFDIASASSNALLACGTLLVYSFWCTICLWFAVCFWYANCLDGFQCFIEQLKWCNIVFLPLRSMAKNCLEN